MMAMFLQRIPIWRVGYAPSLDNDLLYFILLVILCIAGYLVLQISFKIWVKIVDYGSNKPAINLLSLILVPIVAFGVSLAAMYFIIFSGYIILEHVLKIPYAFQSTGFEVIAVILSMLASFVIALIAGGTIADTNSKFKSLQAIIVGIVIVGLWHLYGYLVGGDYESTSSWVKYSGYVYDGGVILFAFFGRYLFDFS